MINEENLIIYEDLNEKAYEEALEKLIKFINKYFEMVNKCRICDMNVHDAATFIATNIANKFDDCDDFHRYIRLDKDYIEFSFISTNEDFDEKTYEQNIVRIAKDFSYMYLNRGYGDMNFYEAYRMEHYTLYEDMDVQNIDFIKNQYQKNYSSRLKTR